MYYITYKYASVCNKTLMSFFKQFFFLQNLPEFQLEAMFQVLKELDEFINLPVTSPDRLSQYRLLRVKVLATVSSDKTYFPYGRLS